MEEKIDDEIAVLNWLDLDCLRPWRLFEDSLREGILLCGIVVLPTLALAKNAKVEDCVVGFDELGGTDEFNTEELEERLAKSQVIVCDGEPLLRASKSKVPSRSVWQSSTSYSSDSN
ncbi:UNVERIFIED_CONTAM: Thioredoxin domain-containing protein 9 [Sesamum indicum]